jgi:hypothetical protein
MALLSTARPFRYPRFGISRKAKRDVPLIVDFGWRGLWSGSGHGFILGDGTDSALCDVPIKGPTQVGQVQMSVDAAELFAGLD